MLHHVVKRSTRCDIIQSAQRSSGVIIHGKAVLISGAAPCRFSSASIYVARFDGNPLIHNSKSTYLSLVLLEGLVGAEMERQGVTSMVQQFSENAVLRWRILGACTCNAAIGICMMMILSILWSIGSLVVPRMRGGVSLQSWSWWLMGASLQTSLIPATIGYVFMLQKYDRIVSIGPSDTYVPVFLSSRLMKLAGRLSTTEGCVRQGVALGLRLVSGIVSLDICTKFLPCAALSFSKIVLLGIVCNVAHHLHCVFWSRDVLVFPSMIKYRWRRWNDRLVPILQRILPVGVSSYLGYATLLKLLGHGSCLSGVGEMISVTLYSCILMLFWSLGDSMADIVMTERPRLGDYDSKKVLGAIQQCLDGKKGELMQMLALYDLSLIPSDGDTNKKKLWRRREIFADDSGVTWNRLASMSTDILSSIICDVERVEDLASTLKTASLKNGSFHPTKWNTIPTGGALKNPAVAVDALDCVLQVAGCHQLLVLSIRFLSDMAYVSVEEDTYGVLQLSEPSLGDIVYTLIKLEQKIRHLGQWTVGIHSIHGIRWRASGEELYSFRRADGCLDVVKSEIRIALENLGSKFGSLLLDTLESNAQYAADTNSTGKQHMRAQLSTFCSTTNE